MGTTDNWTRDSIKWYAKERKANKDRPSIFLTPFFLALVLNMFQSVQTNYAVRHPFRELLKKTTFGLFWPCPCQATESATFTSVWYRGLATERRNAGAFAAEECKSSTMTSLLPSTKNGAGRYLRGLFYVCAVSRVRACISAI